MISSANIVGAQSQGTEETGVTKAYRKLMKKGKTKKAIKFLRKNNVDYGHKRIRATPQGQVVKTMSNPTPSQLESKDSSKQPSSDSDIGTENMFTTNGSTFDFLGYAAAKPLYNVELWWDLAPVPSNSCPDPHDAAAITFSGARWEFEGGSESTSNFCKKFDSRKDGLKVEWDDSKAWATEGKSTGHFWASIEKASPYRGSAQNVWAHFSHTWTPTYKASCLGALLGKSVTLSPGVLGIDTVADKWKVETSNSPIEI